MDINRPDVLASLTKAFYDYEEALVTNHIDRLNELFLLDERTIRFGTHVKEHLVGHQAIAEFRRSRPPGPGGTYRRSIADVLITTYGD